MKMVLALLLTLVFSCFAHAANTQNVNYSPGYLALQDVAIANGGTTSAAINVGGVTLVGITFPATLTSTTVTFTQSPTIGGTYVPVYNSSGAVSVTIAQARYYALDPVTFQGIKFLKIVVGSAEGGARTLTAHLKGLN